MTSNKKPFAFSVIISLLITFIFLIITFWIFYKYSNDSNSAIDALDTTGSYFGAIATLSAAVVAAYLFNDWRVVQSGISKSEQAKLTLLSLIDVQITLDYYLSQVEIYASNFDEGDLEACKSLRSAIEEKYIKLLTQFELNLNYYETVYDEKISNHSEYQINEFNSYFFSINSTLSRIVKKHTDQYESSVLFYLQHAQKRRISFKENTVNKISEKLSPFIILK